MSPGLEPFLVSLTEPLEAAPVELEAAMAEATVKARATVENCIFNEGQGCFQIGNIGHYIVHCHTLQTHATTASCPCKVGIREFEN